MNADSLGVSQGEYISRGEKTETICAGWTDGHPLTLKQQNNHRTIEESRSFGDNVFDQACKGQPKLESLVIFDRDILHLC